MHRLTYVLGKGLGSFRASPLMQLIAISTIAVSVLVLGVVLNLALSLSAVAQQWGEEVRIIAFLGDDADTDTLRALTAAIGAWPEVATVHTRTQAQALADFRASLGAEAALLEGIDAELMPASIELGLRRGQPPAALPQVAARLRGLDGLVQIDDVSYGEALIERLAAARRGLELGGLVLGGLVLLAVVFIVSNTVLLGLYSRQEEIEIMRLVGATHGFIRAPFLVEGAAQGLLGGAAGIGALYLLVGVAQSELGVVLGSGATAELLLTFLPTRWVVGLVLGSGALGVLASYLCVGRWLRTRPGGS